MVTILFSFTKKLFFYIKFNNIIKINGHRSMNTHKQIAFLDPSWVRAIERGFDILFALSHSQEVTDKVNAIWKSIFITLF